jgi:hypothetical protein
VGPGQTLRIRLEARPPSIVFSVHHGTTLVARGQLGDTQPAAAA